LNRLTDASDQESGDEAGRGLYHICWMHWFGLYGIKPETIQLIEIGWLTPASTDHENGTY